MARLSIPPTLSPDLTKVFRQLDAAYVGTNPKYPITLPDYKTSALPKASDYPFSLIWVTDHNSPAISNGTAWHLITLGSSI